MNLTTIDWVVLMAAVVVGSAVQGSLGFGLNVVVAPVAAVVDPALVPAPLLVLATAHVAAMAWSERRSLVIGPVAWVLLGRLPGVAVAVLVLATVTKDTIEVLFGVMLLAVTGLSMYRRGFSRRRSLMVGAGFVSGVTGTAVAVGGPPIALALADSERARAEITSVVVIGTSMSLLAVTASGQLGKDDLGVAAVLLPALAAGFALSRPLVGRLDRHATRAGIHLVAACAATVVLVRGLF